MALKQREIETDFKPAEGVVAVDDYTKQQTQFFLQEAQSCLALKKTAVYVPELDNKLNNQVSKGRVVSYSYALSTLYRNLAFLKKSTLPDGKDSPEMKEDKAFENKLVVESMAGIKEIFTAVANEEYPEAQPTISDDRILMRVSGDPLPFKTGGNVRNVLKQVGYKLGRLSDFIEDKSPNFQKKLMRIIKEYRQYVVDKLDNKDVRMKAKSNEDLMEEVKESIEMLIRDDTMSSRKIDRSRAAEDLAKKLDKMGMELVAVPVREDKSPQEELISQTKTCVLRAAWDGFIERPKGSWMCSAALQEVLYKGVPPVDPQTYNFNDSPVWRTCSQLPVFEELKYELGCGLAEQGFPAEKIKDLTYTDIAMIINLRRPRSSREVEDFQSKKKTVVDGVKIPSGREKFFKQYIHKHEADLRMVLMAQGKTKAYIDGVVQKMRAGKSNESYDGHHNYPISDPDNYEKTTGKSWTQMNGEVKLMEKDAHTLLHMTENNVNAIGRVIMQDAKSSFRTVFKNKESGQKFYYMIRVKEGIDGVMGLNQEMIFNRQYLAGLVLEPVKNGAQLAHVQQRLENLQSKKSSFENNNAANDKQKNTMQRPNYRGLKQLGGNRTLAHIRS